MRNYDYLPDDREELTAEIARLDRQLRDLEDEPCPVCARRYDAVCAIDATSLDSVRPTLESDQIVRLGRDGFVLIGKTLYVDSDGAPDVVVVGDRLYTSDSIVTP
jgi:hypothetical protein